MTQIAKTRRLYRESAVMVAVMLLGGATAAAADSEAQTAPQLVLAEDGRTLWRIVLPGGADVSTNAAAYDLADHLKQMSGATFQVVTDDVAAGGQPEILLGGDNGRLQAWGLEDIAQDFTPEEYEIRTVGLDTEHPALVIAGGAGRGTLNGIYGLLQDHLGCRWFAPGVNRIPRRGVLVLGPLRDRQKPALPGRGIGNRFTQDPLWTARNRLNVDHALGRDYGIRSHPLAATMWPDALRGSHGLSNIPFELYDEHPEFYAEIDGVRTRPGPGGSGNFQVFDMTNEDFAAWVADWCKDYLDRNPHLRVIDLGHHDYPVYGTSEREQEAYARLGVTGVYIQFYNRVAERLVEHYPDVIITMLGYGITRLPPPIEVHPNVRPVFAPLYADFANAFDEGAVNHSYQLMPHLREWVNQTEQRGVWYYFYQADFSMPHPRLFAARRNFQIFRELGVDNVYIQMNHHYSTQQDPGVGGIPIPAWDSFRHGNYIVPWASSHVKAYVGARLLWDPDLSVEELIRDYCATYYGPAAREMAAWFLAVESLDSYQQSLGVIGDMYPDGQIYSRAENSPLLKESVMEEMDARFEAAEAKVRHDPVLLRRVELARWSLQLHLLSYASPNSPLRPPAFEGFFALAEELGFGSVERSLIIGADGSTYAQRWMPWLREVFSEPEKIRITGLDLPSDNRLHNSGFERDEAGDGVPDGWSASARLLPEGPDFDPGSVSLDRSRAVTGQASVRLTKTEGSPTTAGLAQRVEAAPEQEWLATVRYRGRMEAGNLFLRLVALDEAGEYLEHTAATHGHDDTGEDWFRLRAKLTMPTGTRYVEAQVAWDGLGSASVSEAHGVVWVDDLEAGPLPAK